MRRKSLDHEYLGIFNTPMADGVKKTDRSSHGFFVERAADLNDALPQSKECYAYWSDLCARLSGKLPHRGMIQPSEIPDLLAHFYLVDLFEDGKMMLRYRLGGSSVCQLSAMEVKGKRFVDIYDAESHQMFLDIYARIVERRLPFYLRAASKLPGRDFLDIERVMMPFGDESGAVVIVGGVVVSWSMPTGSSPIHA